MGLVSRERINVLNLLYGTLLNSANDAAYTLAENDPGGVSSFVDKMNHLVSSYGLKQTHFANPIGFDDSAQYTTAYDLALLSKEFIKNKILTTITSTKSIVVTDADFSYFHSLNNINELLGEIPHLGGLKTGTTPQAGQNLITYYQFAGHPIIIVLLKSEDRFTDTREIINAIDNQLHYQDVLPAT
jgi:D-alanyl-D-alanine carboxypeptidase